MRDNWVFVIGVIAMALFAWNFHAIMLGLPDEKMQGGIYRLMFLHIPANVAGAVAFLTSMVASILYLATRNMRYDAVAAAVTEVGLMFGAVVLATGMVWARIIWGIWWAWDPRGISVLITILLYAGYVMLRGAIDEPAQRARSSAVLSIFAFPGVFITYKSIDWWRTQHPSAVFQSRGGGGFDPDMLTALMLNMAVFVMIGIVFTHLRTRQETMQRELDGLRREAHSI